MSSLIDEWKERLLADDESTRRQAIADIAALRETLEVVARNNGEPAWLDAAVALWQCYRDPGPAVEGLAVELYDHSTVPDRPVGVMSLVEGLGAHAVPLAPLLARALTSPDLAAHFGAPRLTHALIRLGPPALADIERLLDDGPAREALLPALVHDAAQLDLDLTPLVGRLERLVGECDVPLAVAAAWLLWRTTWRPQPLLFDLGPRDLQSLDRELLAPLGIALAELLPSTPEACAPLRHLLAAMCDGGPGLGEVLPRVLRTGLAGWSLVMGLLAAPTDPLLEELLGFALTEPGSAPLVLGAAREVVRRALDSGPRPSASLMLAAARVIAGQAGAEQSSLPALVRLFVHVGGYGDKLTEALAPLVRDRPSAVRAVLGELARLGALRAAHGNDAVLPTTLSALARLAWAGGRPALREMVACEGLGDDAWDHLTKVTPRGDDARLGAADAVALLRRLLASPAAEIRQRLPRLLLYCPALIDHAWPDLVAALTRRDAEVRDAVLPLFLHVYADLDRVEAELAALRDEPDAAIAASARLALALIGRGDAPDDWSAVGESLWQMMEGMVQRGVMPVGSRLRFHARLRSAPDEVRDRLRRLTYPGASQPDETSDAFFAGVLAAPGGVSRSQMPSTVCADAWAEELCYALLLQGGAAFYLSAKIPLIRAYRTCTGSSLLDSKNAVVGAFDPLLSDDTPEARGAALRALFPAELPVRFAELLDHPLAWFRWAGLVVVEHYGERGAALLPTVEVLLADSAPAVARQARRALGAMKGVTG